MTMTSGKSNLLLMRKQDMKEVRDRTIKFREEMVGMSKKKERLVEYCCTKAPEVL
jgi:thymidine kinase